jgi:DNA-binding Xre family transcriptional regulator
MRIKKAIVLRFQELCKEKNIKYNELATVSGVTSSTVYSMMDSRRKDLSVITIKKLCDGLNISIKDFFDSDLFSDGLEQEIE